MVGIEREISPKTIGRVLRVVASADIIAGAIVFKESGPLFLSVGLAAAGGVKWLAIENVGARLRNKLGR